MDAENLPLEPIRTGTGLSEELFVSGTYANFSESFLYLAEIGTDPGEYTEHEITYSKPEFLRCHRIIPGAMVPDCNDT